MKDEIVLYKTDELTTQIEVRIENETARLNRQQIATLFGRDVKTIGKHINNVFSEGELEKNVVVAKFATTTQHGAIAGKTQTIYVEFYNLDVIISVGYRVKSKRGTQFRIWATKVLKDYLLKGYAFNVRINRVEHDIEQLQSKVGDIDLQIKSSLLPVQGIFFDGQIFDAWKFISDLIRSAKNSIILIDNYIDDRVISLFSKVSNDFKIKIYTNTITRQIITDVEKYNLQFANIELIELKKSHNRFLILDNCRIYHIGASLKDLGKKWFAFSKLDIDVKNLLDKLEV